MYAAAQSGGRFVLLAIGLRKTSPFCINPPTVTMADDKLQYDKIKPPD